MNFQDIISPVDLNHFFESYYTKKAVYIKGCENHFEQLFSYDDLNVILNNSPIPHPTLKLVKEAKLITPTESEDIITAMKDGASLVIDQIHKYNDSVGNISKAVSYALNEPTQVNLYLSQPGIKAFDLHYDTHDVFILQIEGYKIWKVYEPTVEYPLFEMKTHSKIPPNVPYIDVTLNPGDVLYIPRGHWHVALATDEASLHLTLGINSRTGIDFLNWLKDELTDKVLWRKEFPQTNNSNETGLQAHLENLKEDLIEFLESDDLMDRYGINNISKDKKLNPFHFPFQFSAAQAAWQGDTIFKFASYKKYRIVESGEQIILYCENKIIKLKKQAKVAVEKIFELNSFSLKQIINVLSDFNSTQILGILKVLVDNNLLFYK